MEFPLFLYLFTNLIFDFIANYSLNNGDEVKIVKDRNAYFYSAMIGGHSDSVMIRGQKPAFKRIMREHIGKALNLCPKIDLKVIGCLRERLNYQSSSYFGGNSLYQWFQ
jgi:hypothetical protein